MRSRVLSLAGLPEPWIEGLDPARDVVIDWASERRNSVLGEIAIAEALGEELDAAARDLLEVAATLVLGDQCVPRGANEAWVRAIDYVVPVRDVALWQSATSLLKSLLHLLTWDNLRIEFVRRTQEPPSRPQETRPTEADWDCVALLSGGIDSFAGAVTLLASDRRPLLVTHRSPNPTVYAAQQQVLGFLEARYGGRFGSVLVPLGGSRVREPLHPLPVDEDREPSQRARSLWFLAIATVCARRLGVPQVYLSENGVLAAHLPMAASRIGGYSTRTAHPAVLSMFGRLAGRVLDFGVEIINPFVTQTKGEMVRDILRRRVPEQCIRATQSCWQAGRRPRPCGGCVPCLMRGLAFAHAGMGDEVCEVDLLNEPQRHRGTDGYRNLVDLLSIVRDFLDLTDNQLIRQHPDVIAAGLATEVVIATYRRYALEVADLARDRYPELGRLLGPTVASE